MRTFFKKWPLIGKEVIQVKHLMYWSKHFWRLLLCSSICLIAFGVNAALFPSLHAYAAGGSGDPLVAVVVDKTQESSCTETFRANIGTSHESVTHIPCPAGTIMAEVTVHRSQAIAQHEAYVVLPAAQASSSVRQQTLKQIQQLQEAKQTTLRSQISKYAIPATGCGGNGSVSATWSSVDFGGVTLYPNIAFYKSSDCSTAYFTDSQLNSGGNYDSDDWWLFDMYAGYQYNVPSCTDVGVPGHYFHLVDQSAPVGYYYENWVNPFYECDTSEGAIWDNLGPIN
jgi:hypothetical protein